MAVPELYRQISEVQSYAGMLLGGFCAGGSAVSVHGAIGLVTALRLRVGSSRIGGCFRGVDLMDDLERSASVNGWCSDVIAKYQETIAGSPLARRRRIIR
jgi:hypothetical protein